MPCWTQSPKIKLEEYVYEFRIWAMQHFFPNMSADFTLDDFGYPCTDSKILSITLQSTRLVRRGSTTTDVEKELLQQQEPSNLCYTPISKYWHCNFLRLLYAYIQVGNIYSVYLHCDLETKLAQSKLLMFLSRCRCMFFLLNTQQYDWLGIGVPQRDYLVLDHGDAG